MRSRSVFSCGGAGREANNSQDKATEIFGRIQELGVHIAFDDFGTGFASLTYLKKFPFGTLKIDRSFVRELRINPDDAMIVRSTIGLGKMLGLSVIAEGIEDRPTADHAAEHGLRRRPRRTNRGASCFTIIGM